MKHDILFAALFAFMAALIFGSIIYAETSMNPHTCRDLCSKTGVQSFKNDNCECKP